ncbi:MAG: lipoyl(octanoyl) transferase [Bacteroidetes bacterium]|nr:lipoyl(octanoyl) transferase [Bacteroidota bacterium]
MQERLFEANLSAKAAGAPTQNTLIVVEHPHTYTLGKSGDEKNMLFKPETVGAAFHKITRGGDITYHGPGQMVVYPIFDLDTLGMGPAAFVAALEDTAIDTVAHYGIVATRLADAPGIWLDAETAPRKICAVGLRISRGCTMHGIALNVNTDLKYFSYIVPCGLPDKAVTSLKKELGREVSMDEVREAFLKNLQSRLQINLS